MTFLNPAAMPFGGHPPGGHATPAFAHSYQGNAHVATESAGVAAEEYEGEVQQISELLDRLLLGSGDDPAELGYAAAVAGVRSLDVCHATRRLREALDNAHDAAAREGALRAVAGLAGVGKAAEPYTVPLLPLLLERMGDKVAGVRDAACAAAGALVGSLTRLAVPVVMPMLYEAMKSRTWQAKEGALKLLKQLAVVAPDQVAAALPEIVPNAGECLIDPREQVWACECECECGCMPLRSEISRVRSR